MTSRGNPVETYSEEINSLLWAWADAHLKGQLDGGDRRNRPPVLIREFAHLNVLMPIGGKHKQRIQEAIPAHKRHMHFGSLRSSQALAQSVFGALAAYGRLDIVERLKAECGRPALCNCNNDWNVELEHDVGTLGEPRPTSIDVLLTRPGYRIAIECKFTEPDFGTCSRPRLRPRDANYETQFCDGTYSIQRGRTSRCALSEIGVRYWEHLPSLFNWDAASDQSPCPFGSTYQVARNALTAAVTDEGLIDVKLGHALIVYDARNPAFQSGGVAHQQWEDAAAACLVSGLLRKTTWQKIVGALADDEEMLWLGSALQEKYGFRPDRT